MHFLKYFTKNSHFYAYTLFTNFSSAGFRSPSYTLFCSSSRSTDATLRRNIDLRKKCLRQRNGPRSLYVYLLKGTAAKPHSRVQQRFVPRNKFFLIRRGQNGKNTVRLRPVNFINYLFLPVSSGTRSACPVILMPRLYLPTAFSTRMISSSVSARRNTFL